MNSTTSTNPTQQPQQPTMCSPGTPVSTPFGDGTVISCCDGQQEPLFHYTIELSFGKLYCVDITTLHRHQSTMQLEAAFQCLEQMRKLNLEVQCHEMGVAKCRHDVCAMCLIETATPKDDPGAGLVASTLSRPTAAVRNVFSRARGSTPTSEPKPPSKLPKNPPPCLICGAPTCTKKTHSSAVFHKEKICVCVKCEELFQSNLLVEAWNDYDSKLLQQRMEALLDIYDRVLLLLRYSEPLMNSLAAQLEYAERKNNQVKLGTSSTSMVSGALGFAGMAAVLTPAGPPLLLASVLTGGTSTAVQVSQDAKNYFNESQKLANRILVLHGMLLSLLSAMEELQNVLRNDLLLSEQQQDASAKVTTAPTTSSVGRLSTGISVTRKVDTGLKVGSAAGTTTKTLSGMWSAVPLLGPTISAAFMAMDGKEAKRTLRHIQEGSPCDKAVMLRAISNDLKTNNFPSTEMVDTQCQMYVEAVKLKAAVIQE